MKILLVCILVFGAISSRASDSIILNCGPYNLKVNTKQEHFINGDSASEVDTPVGFNYNSSKQIKLSNFAEDLGLYLTANPNPIVQTGVFRETDSNVIHVFSKQENIDLNDASKVLDQLNSLLKSHGDLESKEFSIFLTKLDPMLEANFDTFSVQILCSSPQ